MLCLQMAEIIKVGWSRETHKTLYFMFLPRLRDWPDDLQLPSKHCGLFLAWDARRIPRAMVQQFGERLIEQGIVKLAVWGPDCCRRVHIPFAEDVIFKMSEDASINHDCYSGTLKQALWMFVRWGDVQSRYKRTCRTWLVVAVANRNWSQFIRRSLGGYTRKPA